MLPKIIFCTGGSSGYAYSYTARSVLSSSSQKASKEFYKPLDGFFLVPSTTSTFKFQLPECAPPDAGALIFRRALTDGPENTSLVVGKAQGFIIPVEQFAQSAFNVIYLTFHTQEYSGSLSVQAKNFGHKDRDELIVVGGTGSFAFARGIAVLEQTTLEGSTSHVTYKIKLKLEFPDPSRG